MDLAYEKKNASMIKLLRKISTSIGSSVSNLDQHSSVMTSPGTSSGWGLGGGEHSSHNHNRLIGATSNESIFMANGHDHQQGTTSSPTARPTYKDFDMPKTVTSESDEPSPSHQMSSVKATIHRLSNHRP